MYIGDSHPSSIGGAAKFHPGLKEILCRPKPRQARDMDATRAWQSGVASSDATPVSAEWCLLDATPLRHVRSGVGVT